MNECRILLNAFSVSIEMIDDIALLDYHNIKMN